MSTFERKIGAVSAQLESIQPAMSGPWDAKYTDEQKEACALARIDGGRTARRVAEMAVAGELRLKGEPVGAFDISANYVNQLGQKLKRDRSGKTASKVAELPHRDAIEVLRRRLIAVAESVVADLEKTAQKDAAKLDLERHRQAIRCVLEASKLPGPTAPRTAAQEQDGQKPTRTVGGMAGALLKDHRQAEPAQDNPQRTTDLGDHERSTEQHARSNGSTDGGPGALPSEQQQAPSTERVVV